MKGCFTTLLLALIAAFIAAFFGRSCHRQGVEEILTERVASELKTQYPGVDVKYDHLTAIVSGTADESQLQEIRARVKELALGNGRVYLDVSGKESVPAPKLDLPYFTIIRDSGKIILDGMVDSGQTKAYLGQAALRDLGKFGLENQIQVGAKTAPYPDFGNVVEAIPVLLKQAEDAKVEANPGRVVVSGTVADENVKKTLLGLFDSSKWNGAEIVDQIKIKPAPVVPQRTEPASFSVTRQNNTLKLTGTVDSEQTKNAIGNAAKIDGVTVDNQIKVSDTTMAFPGLSPVLAGIPSLISSAKNGKIDVDTGKVTLSGLVDNKAARDSVIGFYSGDQWAGTEIINRIKVKPTQAPAFVIERNNDKLVLRGTVDSQRTKNMLANAAKLEGVAVENQINISEEVMAFPELNATLTAIPGLLNSAKNGKIDVRQKKVVVSGLVDNRPGKNSVMGFFSGPQWKGVEVVDQIRIKPNLPPSFAVERKSDKVTLTGMVDKPATKARLGDAAKLEGVTVDNKIKVNEEVLPFPEFDSAVSSIPVFIGSTQNGKIEMTPSRVDISGGVTDQAAQSRLREFFAGLNWKGPKFDGDIKIASMPTRAPSFVIERNAGKLTLTGEVDSPEAKMALGNAAKLEGLTVDNQIKVSDEVTSFPAMEQTVKGVPVLVKAADNGKIEVASDKVVLHGMVNNKAAKDMVLSQFSTDDWKGPKVVDKVTIKPKKVAPTFAWKQDGPKKAILSGKVPDVKVRDSLVAAAKKRLGADGEVVDKMVIDSNVRNDPWLSALPVFASQSMPKVEMPDINIDAQKASISGKVPNSTVMNDVSLAFSGINPPGKLDVQLDVVKPQPPKPATMPARTAVPDVAVTGTGQRLTVAGKVPNQKTHDTIVNSILGMEDIDHLDKKLKIGNDVKEETYLDALPDFIGNFYNGSVKERELWLKNKELTLRGVLPSEAEKNKTLAMAEPLKKKGVKVIDLLTVEAPKKKVKAPEPPTVAMNTGDKPDENQPSAMAGENPPQPTVNDKPPAKVPDNKKDAPRPVDPEKGELHSVYFGTGEFHIRDSQKPRAEKLLERAKQTSGKIVIDGYADERGEEETNVFLSDQRAKRIRAYLISNGIDQSRIVSVVGRGEIPNGKYREYRRTDVRIIESR